MNQEAALPTRPGPIFLSYSRADRDAAIAARIALEREGFEVFHDIERIHAGEDWMARLQEALQACSGFIVLVGRDGVRRWVGAEVQVAVNRRFSARDGAPPLPIYPVLLRGTTPEALPPFLSLFQATPWAPEQPLPAALFEGLRLQRLAGAGAGRFDGCPFVGLKSFQARDARLFFGRGQETLDALASLGAQQPVHPEHPPRADAATHARWLQIEGASGSGKSSLVNAGLLPMIERGALWARTGCDAWQVLGPMLPGADPLERLADVLEHALVPAGASRRTLERLAALEGDERALSIALRDARTDDRAFLLVVDQFEELFTLSDPARRRLFDGRLAHALDDPLCPLYLVSTVRSDFLDRFELLPRLQRQANRSCKRYLLPLISEDGLREVIERPAQLAGLDVREVVGAILDDARDEVGALPLVENALYVLWSEREGDRLTAAAYRRLNGLAGMLSSQADALLDRVDADVRGGRSGALELLLRLTRIGSDGRQTRQRITRGEAVLVAGDGDAARGERIVRLLSGEAGGASRGERHGEALRLITAYGAQRPAGTPAGTDGEEDGGEQFVDLIHETLIRDRSAPDGRGPRVAYWPTLFDYVAANRDRDLDRQQLRLLADAWSRRRGLARWWDLPGWADLLRYRRLRVPPQTPEGRYLRRGLVAAGWRAAAAVLAGAAALVLAESLIWSRQPPGLSEFGTSVSRQKWPLSYALHRPLWLLGFVPQPDMAVLAGGRFRMGCVAGRDDAEGPCQPDEVHPQPWVEVAGPLSMSRGPVTFRQYDAYVVHGLSRGEDGLHVPEDRSFERGNRPVVGVAWNEARAYADWLGRRSGRHCRLPTEAEWEFAARAAGGSGAGPTLPGPVAEWTDDPYAPYPGATDARREQAGDADAPRAVRGLSSPYEAPGSRVAGRTYLMPDERAVAVGFRVVCAAPPAPGTGPAR